MTEAEKKELTDKIAAQEAQIKEFADNEKAALEVKAKAEADAADEKIRGEIKVFCDQMKTEGKYVEADEKAGLPELMFTLAKNGKSYKEFFNGRQIVPVGIQPGIDDQPDKKTDTRSQVIVNAELYVKDHLKDKEFAGMSLAEATNRAVYLHSTGKIKFASK